MRFWCGEKKKCGSTLDKSCCSQITSGSEGYVRFVRWCVCHTGRPHPIRIHMHQWIVSRPSSSLKQLRFCVSIFQYSVERLFNSWQWRPSRFAKLFQTAFETSAGCPKRSKTARMPCKHFHHHASRLTQSLTMHTSLHRIPVKRLWMRSSYLLAPRQSTHLMSCCAYGETSISMSERCPSLSKLK